MRRKIVFLALSLSFTIAVLAHRAEAAICTEGSTRASHIGECCSFGREVYELQVCQDGFWSPTGEYICSGFCGF